MNSQDDYQAKLAAWKTSHGLDADIDQNADELRMAAEEQASKKTSWCLDCDKEMPVRDMKLITRRIDPYTQCDEGETDYIAFPNRVRMCPECFHNHYVLGIV